MKKILIVGATSAIATACARRWAMQSSPFFLVGRTTEKLGQVADDLAARGAPSRPHVLDLNHYDQHSALLDPCYAAMGRVDIALVTRPSYLAF